MKRNRGLSTADFWRLLLVVGHCLVGHAAHTVAGPPPFVDTTGNAPSDAVVIFGGESTDRLRAATGERCRWPIENGELVCDPSAQIQGQGIWTTLHFADAQVHCEFTVPDTSANDGNSGLYFHALYEQQIRNTFNRGHESPETLVGAVYNYSPPLVHAARPAGEWQTYDILFRAPERDVDGKIIGPGSLTAFLNGVLVQDHVEFDRRLGAGAALRHRATPYAERIRESLMKTACGPLMLQDHGSGVRFRNIWIRPLDSRSFF